MMVQQPAPATRVGDPDLTADSWSSPGCCRHLEKDLAGRSTFSLTHIHSAFQVDEKKIFFK